MAELDMTMTDKKNLDADERLVRAAQADISQFRPLYDRWIQPLYRYIAYRISDPNDAEDICSRVFIKIYAKFPKYRHIGCFSAWLFTIARNEVNSFYRHKPTTSLPDELADTENIDIGDLLMRQDRQKRLRRLLAQLQPDEQELISLRYVARLTYPEIGAALAKSSEAARKMHDRLIRRLQTKMETDND